MPDAKSLLPGRAFRSEHAQLRPEPHSIASHGPAPMDPLQTTRMRNGVLYAAEWPCCHDPLRLSLGSEDPFYQTTHAFGARGCATPPPLFGCGGGRARRARRVRAPPPRAGRRAPNAQAPFPLPSLNPAARALPRARARGVASPRLASTRVCPSLHITPPLHPNQPHPPPALPSPTLAAHLSGGSFCPSPRLRPSSPPPQRRTLAMCPSRPRRHCGPTHLLLVGPRTAASARAPPAHAYTPLPSSPAPPRSLRPRHLLRVLVVSPRAPDAAAAHSAAAPPPPTTNRAAGSTPAARTPPTNDTNRHTKTHIAPRPAAAVRFFMLCAKKPSETQNNRAACTTE